MSLLNLSRKRPSPTKELPEVQHSTISSVGIILEERVQTDAVLEDDKTPIRL